MKKKKGIIISIIIVIVLVFCLIAYFVDKSRVQNNKEPIFSYNQSGGSAILYFGPGYVISGTSDASLDDIKCAKFYTWINLAIELIQEEVSVRENNVTTFSKDEGVSVLKMTENTSEIDEELLKQIEELYGKGTGEASWVEHSDLTVENEHYIRVYGINYEGETVWDYQTPKENVDKEFYSIEYLGDEILNVQGTLIRLDLKTGTELWTYSGYDGSNTIYTKEDQPLSYAYIDYCLYSQSSNKLFIMHDNKLIDMYDMTQYIKEYEFSNEYENSVSVVMHEQHVYLSYEGLNKEKTKLLRINYDIDIQNKKIDSNKEEYNYNGEL